MAGRAGIERRGAARDGASDLEKIQASAELAPLVASAGAYKAAGKARRTVDSYRKDWGAFEAWCRAQGLTPLPAAPETVALYLTARVEAGRKVATLQRELAAIAEAHRSQGFPSPRTTTTVRAVLAGIRRKHGTAQQQKRPLLPGDLRRIVERLSPARLIDVRDRALLCLGFAGAFRRSELVALEVADLAFVDEGLQVTLRRSKTDQEAEGRRVGVPHGQPETCPVRAVRAWLEAAGITEGPVFRAVTRHGKVGGPLSGRSVARVVKRSARAVGLESAGYAGHSLRAGLVTAAARAGKSEAAIMRQTGHRSTAMVRRYVREATLFQDNAADGVL